jgi:CRISPR/Cas system CMR subunit Cmr4 (Cas7 group RAMP superfamily)
LHIARFVIEAQSGFSLASGLTDVAFDNLVVRDANGLPAIPGTSLAGVIRCHYEKRYPPRDTGGHLALSRLFGDHLKKSATNENEESIKSRVEFSWGVIHDSKNEPVEGLHTIKSDPLIEFLQQDHPIVRDRVRINEAGCAEHQAKFDKTTIPRGVRFSAEMALWADVMNPIEWDQLCRMLFEEPLRLGSSVGVGMGHFRCVSLKCRLFDLKKKDDYKDYASLDPSLNKASAASWNNYDPASDKSAATADQSTTQIKLTLLAEDFWRIGQGEAPLKAADNPPDLRPYYEPLVKWNHDKARLETRSFVIPGSSIKGALRHRFQFHYARQLLPLEDVADFPSTHQSSENKASKDSDVRESIEEHAIQAADYVFGSASDTSENVQGPPQGSDLFGTENKGGDGDATTTADAKGHKSRLLVCDAELQSIPTEQELFHMTHTSIDRFTGGVRQGALYTEELIWKNTMTTVLEFQHYAFEKDEPPKPLNAQWLVNALKWTLADLTDGRLALGGGSAKGHGYFSGSMAFEPDMPAVWKNDREVIAKEVA